MEANLKEKVLAQLGAFQVKVDAAYNNRGEFKPTSQQFMEYDEILAELSIYIAKYTRRNAAKQIFSVLLTIDTRPKESEFITDSFEKINTATSRLREYIRTDNEFDANVVPTSDAALGISRDYFSAIVSAFGGMGNLGENNKLRQDILILSDEKRGLEEQAENMQYKLKDSQFSIESRLQEIATLTSSCENSNAELEIANKELLYYKEQAQKTEVARNSADFQKQAEGNKKTAYKWMWAIIAAGILFIAFLWHMFSSDAELFSVATGIIGKSKGIDPVLLKQLILVEIGKKIGSKVLIVSLLTYVVTFLVKNYNAQMHNYVVNSHKANALRSTVDLIGTARGDDGNDKIILQATQAIFTTQKSGYQGADSEPASPNLITNVIDAVAGGKK